MPYVKIEMLEGRTSEQKRLLAEAVTETVCASLECKPESVWVVIDEKPASNWAVAGSTLAETTKF